MINLKIGGFAPPRYPFSLPPLDPLPMSCPLRHWSHPGETTTIPPIQASMRIQRAFPIPDGVWDSMAPLWLVVLLAISFFCSILPDAYAILWLCPSPSFFGTLQQESYVTLFLRSGMCQKYSVVLPSSFAIQSTQCLSLRCSSFAAFATS